MICPAPLRKLLLILLAMASLTICNATGFAQRQKPVIQPVREVTATRTQPAPQAPADDKIFQAGPVSHWIWGGKPRNRDSYYLEKDFSTTAQTAQLIATCDNEMTVWLNDKQVMRSTTWEQPVKANVSKHLKPGANRLVVRVGNQGSAAGLAVKLVLQGEDKKSSYVISDKSWRARDKKGGDAHDVVVVGKMGDGPWGNVFGRPKATLLANLSRDVFDVRPGFQVELLYTVPKNEQGSWVSIAFDPKGRLIASDQGNKGLFRITPPPVGSEGETVVEHLTSKISSAQGMLYAFGNLYVSVNGGPGSGLYVLRDTNDDDQFDEVTQLKKLRGGGEHGPHAVRLSPDGKSLYVIAGNHTDPPEKFDTSRVPKNWSEDLLLPRQWDARGHARGKLAPGGWIAKTDPAGKTWEIVSTGYRNPYDMAFNVDGELFAYDADMEWDLGSPWYRPTRVVHAASGSEFGWRSGTGKWPAYYVDSLPEVVDVGPGSPVGVTFGYGTKFPAKYQRALYLCDWTFGTIFAIHTTPQGASYIGAKEEFVSRAALPLTDAEVGLDGALYFTVGGRGTQSALYRVTYTGDESTAPALQPNKEFAELRALRRKLEASHQSVGDPAAAVDFAWENLAHADRHIRYAARLALEHQDVELWRERVLLEKEPQALITAAVALARQGEASDQDPLVKQLSNIDLSKLTEAQQLELLRAYALSFIRLGKPNQATAAAIAKELDGYFPSKNPLLNRELSRLLVYLNSPTVVRKTIALLKQPATPSSDTAIPELLARNPGYGGTVARMLTNSPDLQRLHYALVLRNVRFGWTLEERKDYFEFLNGARNRSGGASYEGFINNIRTEALANASEQEKAALGGLTKAPPTEEELPKAAGPGRKWSLEDILGLQSKLADRDFKNGARSYDAAKCIRCHRFSGSGGSTGPDLTNSAGRFSIKDLAEAIVAPSRVISDQYRAMSIVANGRVISGRIIGETKTTYEVLADPVDATKVITLKKDDIERMTPSKTSLMPAGLIDELNEDELLNLMAYLLSRGNPNDLLFASGR